LYWTPAFFADNIGFFANSSCCHRRSLADRTYVIPHTCNTFGDQGLIAACLQVWNNVPSYDQT